MWSKVKVLLWKSLQLRKRHWFITITELIIPCLLFYLMSFLESRRIKSNYITIVNQSIPDPVSEKNLFKYFMNSYSSGYFIYTPFTLETEQIMNIVATKLEIPSNNIETASNEDEMIQKFKIKFNTSYIIADGFGIVFEKTIKSTVLKYKIRSTSDVWSTDILFPVFEEPGPMNSGQVYIKKGFLSLQLALDITFISLGISNTAVLKISDYNLNIQSYPYAKYNIDSNIQVINTIFPYFTVLSFLLMCSITIKRVVEEKDSGIRELMKMMGLKSWIIWVGWILHNFFVYALSITAITYISCYEIFYGKGQLLSYTNPLLLWIFLTMYMITGIFFCFAVSSLFNRPLIALISGNTLWYFSYSLPVDLSKLTTSTNVKTVCMLLPNYAIIEAYTSIQFLETRGIGLQFSNLFTTENSNNSFSVGFVLFMFIIDCFLYGVITWYMDSVMPGKYGVAKPLHFFCKCSKNKTDNNISVPIRKRNNKLFEKPPNGYKIGISVQNLKKRFGNFYAINGVNLDLYKGQITALLGHNGAGKTTTMSIITGLFSPSSGSVIVNGNDLFSDIDRYRDNLGLCPQYNLLFSYLTTLDHLIFFGMLKGMPLQKAKSEGLDLLQLLNMSQKKNELVSNLSGGMKRKLSLANALVGSPEILILDEPTSGMDPKSRREVWDLLLSFRGARTILITTHFMEEADVLGDRIAIMSHGQVKCYGTSLFLKKAYGAGYNLTIVKEEPCAELKILTEIKAIIPEAEILRSLTTQLVINLPSENTDQFPYLFTMLENNRDELCIKEMGISFITMEEVFLKAEETVLDYDDDDSPFTSTIKDHRDEPKHSSASDATQTLVSKCIQKIKLLKNQFKVLVEKKILYTYRRWSLALVFGIGPVLVGILIITFSNSFFSNSSNRKGLHLSLSTYKDTSVYYRAGDNSTENLKPQFVTISKINHVTVNEASSNNYIIDDLLKMCSEDEFKYRTNLMIAGDFNKTNSTVIYNNIAIHTPAIAVNLYSNALLQKFSGNNESYISTVNEPIQLKKEIKCNKRFDDLSVLLWFTIFTPSFLYLVGYFIALPLNERVSGFKHLQLMTKLSPIMYWFTCFFWDYFCYVIVVLFTLIAMYLFDEYHIFTGREELGVLLTILIIYGVSAIFYAYVYSFFTKSLISSMLLYMSINYISGLLINTVLHFLRDYITVLSKTNPYNKLNFLRHIILIIPNFSFTSCIDGYLQITWENNRCKICNSLDRARECNDSSDIKPKSYFVFHSGENQNGILEEILYLIFSSILYIAIILLFDYKIFACLYQFCFNKIVSTGISHKDDDEDPDIDVERDNVEAAKNRSNGALPPNSAPPLHGAPPPLLLVDNLVKRFSFKFTGVRGISFAVPRGECFGLLGVNGAGKTTTFRILTRDLFPSGGDASIQTNKLYKLSSDIKQYTSMIGYCPQFDALNDKLTTRESLKLMAILRGMSPSNADKHINKWTKLLGLEQYKNRPCGNYSGGNKRKLNTGMALIGDPPVVFLDEPTSGVDPVARRNLWKILTANQRGGQAVILTSNSMDECEALCNRLTIMVDGKMKCIGNIQYLKNRYGQGFTVMVKLRHRENINEVITLKADIERQFTPDIHLKDEHKGLLHYHVINPRILMSEIFNRMKKIKDNYSVIEDYTVGDTTLEQLFIAFAKKQAVLNTNS